MAELPGWTRERLQVASPADVAAARLIVFGREVRSFLERDFVSELSDLQERAPKEQERYEKRRRAQAREGVLKAMKLQAHLRVMLGLDEEPDA